VDIFAWAVTMIFAATGRLAFGGDSVMAVMMRIMNEVPDVTGVPDSLRPVIIECLDKDPARRPKARDIMLRLVDPSAPYPQQTLATPAGQGVPGFPVDSVPLGHLHTLGTGPAAFDPRTGAVPELPGPRPAGYTPPGYTPPGYTPPGYTPPGPPARPNRSRRGLAVAAGSAAAVVVLAVVGVLLLTKGSPPTSPSGTSSSTPPASAGSTPPASSPPATTNAASGATIPAAFAGTWKGTATLAAIGAPGLVFKNAITFTMAAGGTTAAENEAGGCVNTLTLASTTATVLTFSEPQAGGCVAGTVTFTRQGAALAYRWTNNVEQETATLSKS
jgi:hypothetical protein